MVNPINLNNPKLTQINIKLKPSNFDRKRHLVCKKDDKGDNHVYKILGKT